MSRAILVLNEMPENCDECIIKHEDYGVCLSKERPTPRKSNKRPDWCPLREMPEQAKNDEFWDDGSIGYVAGWNDCLRVIEGSEEDETVDSKS